MPSVPPPLEAIVGMLLPPACREEVLGDLCERFTGPGQYIGSALCVIPWVILSRIRRTTDVLLLATEALLIYGSFLVAAWYTDRALLMSEGGLLRLAIPTAIQLAGLMLHRAWGFELRSSMTLFQGAIIGISIAFSASGTFASVLLVSVAEIAFRREKAPMESAAGSAVLVNERAGRRILSEGVKSFLIAVAAACLVAFSELSTGISLGRVEVLIVAILVIGIRFSTSRKE